MDAKTRAIMSGGLGSLAMVLNYVMPMVILTGFILLAMAVPALALGVRGRKAPDGMAAAAWIGIVTSVFLIGSFATGFILGAAGLM